MSLPGGSGAAARTSVMVAVCTLLIAACGSADTPDAHQLAQAKWGTGEVLTDLDPMVERVPALATATAVSYLGGSQAPPADERGGTVPGPTDLWIDAAVTFSPGDSVPANECAAESAAADSARAPDVVGELKGDLGAGPWVVCAQGAFAAQGWDVTALLDADANVVVLEMTTQ